VPVTIDGSIAKVVRLEIIFVNTNDCGR
jgi:hypothetical protein